VKIYQIDAIGQALNIIEKYNGVILADVVGLGKTVIACAIAKQLKKRGIVICPPGLIGDKNKTAGWKKYLEDFELYDWDARSLGDLESVLEYVNTHEDIEVVIIDEAHRFRNQDTRAYELLRNICRNRIVIALTATPFNNKPSDIFSIIKLFIVPKKSTITIEDDLEVLFSVYKRRFDKLSYISRYYNSRDNQKVKKAKIYFEELFGGKKFDPKMIKNETHRLAKEIRQVIEPITIRRNRIDLINNSHYRNEAIQLSKVKDPIEWFFELTPTQSEFYDKVIGKYFADEEEGGEFKGAIYRPFLYEEGKPQNNEDTENNENQLEKNREFYQQTNLFNFMRRLLVKRFESSFGSFKKSIENFKNVHLTVLNFIEKTGEGDPLKGKYILDRNLIEKIYEMDMEDIEKCLIEYEETIRKGEYPKKNKVYEIKNFKNKEQFISDIKSDIELFDKILNELEKFDLINNDPKIDCLLKNLKDELDEKTINEEPKRKIIVFSEFIDTVKYIEQKLNDSFNGRVLVVKGYLPDFKFEEIYSNFDASYKKQEDNYDILLCTDKISEGFNLNRAGMIVNYDIPRNPVRVIQRLGRINRIGKKVFDELFIVNFFPTEKGSEIVKSREIAQNKMFMIHNTLGEDAKIFDIDEEPSAAELYKRLQQNPETLESESIYTKVFNIFENIQKKYPEIVKNLDNLPYRIKVSKRSKYDELFVIFKKSNLFVLKYDYKNAKVEKTTFEEILDKINCSPEEKGLSIDERFWDAYVKIKKTKEERIPTTEISLFKRALTKLNYLITEETNKHLQEYKEFLLLLREDLLEYGTLSEYTKRRIANLKSDYKNEEQLKKLIEEISSLYKELGKIFLQKEKMENKDIRKEIIIAIENKQL